MQFIHGAL